MGSVWIGLAFVDACDRMAHLPVRRRGLLHIEGAALISILIPDRPILWADRITFPDWIVSSGRRGPRPFLSLAGWSSFIRSLQKLHDPKVAGYRNGHLGVCYFR